MKKFRLFAMLAVLATFSTIFAAWNYYNYADEFTSAALDITIYNVNVSEAEEISPIKLDATSDVALTVNYEQDANNQYLIKGVVSSDVTVTVTEIEPGATDNYEYSFGIYSPSEDVSTDDYIPSEDGVKKTAITVENGKATISAAAIGAYFDYELPESENFEDFKNTLQTFNAMKTANTLDKPVCLKVYATKK